VVELVERYEDCTESVQNRQCEYCMDGRLGASTARR